MVAVCGIEVRSQIEFDACVKAGNIAIVIYPGDECLAWPYARDSSVGRGRLGYQSRIWWAHRLMREHGTAKKKGAPRRILSDDDVAAIRELKGTMTYPEIAARFGVKYRTIGMIMLGHERLNRPKRHGARYWGLERAALAAKVKELRTTGLSYRNIANAVGCSPVTAKNLFRQSATGQNA